MKTGTLVRVSQSGRFNDPTRAPLARPSPAPPVVLQHLLESVAKLTQKVDALANTGLNQNVLANDGNLPKAPAKKVRSKQIVVKEVQNAPQARKKLDRRKMRSIFD